MKKKSGYVWKLGMFVIIGIVFFISTLYFVGKNRNLFGTTFRLKSKFNNVNGLKIGNNVRFSGINIGTVEDIDFESDTVVIVNLLIKEEVRQYIKIDALTSIGSDGLMGDKVLSISPGTSTESIVNDNATILSNKSIEMDDIMKSVKKSVDNAAVISKQFAQFSYKMNNKDGVLSKLMTDASFANSLEKTIVNLESSSNEFAVFTKKMNNKNSVLSKLVNDEKLGKSIDTTIRNIQTATHKLNEIEEAAKHNFLLRGYFNKKEKEEVKKKK
jgi:phospholipid/cholesterol/gamma-HCH transport system substrate-binding protein